MTIGQVTNFGLSAASLTYVSAEFFSGKATTADLTVNIVTTSAGVMPVVGEFATGAQLIWDLLDPLHPW